MRTSRNIRKKKILYWIGGIVGVCLLTAAIYALFFMKELTETAKEMHEPIERPLSEKREEPIVLQEKEPFSVLILGVDEREGDKGRSDTMIVLAVNPTIQSTKMLSIPRDTYVDIAGLGMKDKLNHAYAFGGIEMAMETVEDFLDIPIDYVVQVNMESFKEIINAVGGVSVHNPLDFKVDNFSFPKGDIQLNGEEALAFVRMRHDDPRGDFGRQDRQKQVVQAILHEGASLNSLLNYKDIFDAIGSNVRTNMSFDEMVEVQKNYRNAAKSVDQLSISKGHGEWMDRIWYYMMDPDELEAVQTEFKQHLGVE